MSIEEARARVSAAGIQQGDEVDPDILEDTTKFDILSAVSRKYPERMDKSDIQDETGFCDETVERHVDELYSRGVLRRARTIANPQRYTLEEGDTVAGIVYELEEGERLGSG